MSGLRDILPRPSAGGGRTMRLGRLLAFVLLFLPMAARADPTTPMQSSVATTIELSPQPRKSSS